MSEIPNIHDRYFREFLDNPGIAAKFLQEILPEELKEMIDFSFIKPEQGSFISQELKEAYSDLLFKSRLKKGQEVYIYFLIEHKSYMYEQTAFQLLKYMVSIWEREINREGKKKLTPIIPVVFYHGEEAWKADEEFLSLVEGLNENPGLEKYLPCFKYLLFELGDKEKVEKAGEKVVRLLFRTLFLRKIKGEKESRIFLMETLREIKELGGEYSYLFISIMLYIINTREDIGGEEFFRYVEEILPERREDVMTIAEQLRREGRQEGIEIGIKEGMEKGIKEGIKKGIKEGMEKGIEKTALKALQEGLDEETVAKITGLSRERINELKKQLN